MRRRGARAWSVRVALVAMGAMLVGKLASASFRAWLRDVETREMMATTFGSAWTWGEVIVTGVVVYLAAARVLWPMIERQYARLAASPDAGPSDAHAD